jgi:tetratricopeptide (TPR) repeat protein
VRAPLRSPLLTVTDALGRRDVVLICGAGISLDPPAGLPDWHELRDGTIRAIAARHPGLAEHVPMLTAAEMLALPGKRGMSPELVAGTVRSHCPGYFASFAAMEDGEPNANHRRLAEAAAAGAVSLIVTTNFDVFVERALEAAGVAFKCCRTAAEFAAFDADAGGVQLLKIHGCITAPDTIVATVEQETVGLGAAKIAAMDRLLPGRWQVFWGYSGADLKIDLDYLRGQTNRDAAAGMVWSLFAGGGFEEAPNAYVAELVGEYGERGMLGHNLLPAAFDEVLGPATGGPAATVSDAERSTLRETKTERLRAALMAWAKAAVSPIAACQVIAELLLVVGEWERVLACAHHVADLATEPDANAMLVALDLSKDPLLALGRGAEAMDAALRVQELARMHGDRRRLAGALNFEAGAHASVGSTAIALRRLGEALLALSELGDQVAVARVQFQMGKLERNRGRLEVAKTLYEQAEAAALGAGALRIVADALIGQIDLHLKWGEVAEAERALERARDAALTYGDRGLLGEVLFQEGTVLIIRGDLDGARLALERALQQLELAHETSITTMVRDSLAKVAAFSGDRPRARALQLRVVEEMRAESGPRLVGMALLSAANLLDNDEDPRPLVEEALTLLTTANDSYGAAIAASRLAPIEQASGEPHAALQHYQQAVALYRRAASYGELGDLLKAMAPLLAERRGEPRWELAPVVLGAMGNSGLSEEALAALLDDSAVEAGADVRSRLEQAPDAEAAALAINAAVKRITEQQLVARDFASIAQWSLFAFEVANAVGDLWSAGVYLNDAGMAYSNLGEPERAVALLSASLDCARTLADAEEATLRAFNLAKAHERAGDIAASLAALRAEEVALPHVLDRPVRLKRELSFAEHYDNHRAWDDSGRMFTLVRDDARLAGELSMLARAHHGRGKAMRELGEPERAGDERLLAMELYLRTGVVQAAALMALLAGVCFKDVPARAEDARSALTRAIELGERAGLAEVVRNAGSHLATLGMAS